MKQNGKNHRVFEINVKMHALRRNYSNIFSSIILRILINQPVNCNNCTGNERNCSGLFALSSTNGDQLIADLDHLSR